MNGQYSNLILELESNFRNLIAKYSALQAENNALKADLERKNEELMHAHKDILDLRSEYTKLETAVGLGGSPEKSEKAKLHINKLVREIDKCLTLLNE